MSSAPLAIVDRQGWHASPLSTPANTIAVPTPELWLHHTGSTGLHGASGMRSLQSGAIAGGYVDIEYTYVIDTDGTVYVARGPAHDPAATGGRNSISHAICAMGNFQTQSPSNEMLDAIARTVAYMWEHRWLKAPHITGPHRDAPDNATACCGINLINRIDDINADASAYASGAPIDTDTTGGAVQLASTPSGKGYWVADSTGAVFAYGDARYYGGANTTDLNAPIVGIAARPQGDGYWLAASDGGVFAYGTAPFKGSAGDIKLNAPIVGITAADDGAGYWLLANDGGVFAYGTAPFKGAPTGMVH